MYANFIRRRARVDEKFSKFAIAPAESFRDVARDRVGSITQLVDKPALIAKRIEPHNCRNCLVCFHCSLVNAEILWSARHNETANGKWRAITSITNN
jgi:hypothetical protein